MPTHELIAEELITPDGEVCALGALGVACGRSYELEQVDPEDYEQVSVFFNVSEALAREVQYINDECGPYDETPAARWTRVRRWVQEQIIT